MRVQEALVLMDAHVKAHTRKGRDPFKRVSPADGITYCFLFWDDPDPRGRRKALLQKMCWIARGMFPQNKKVLGIATEKLIRQSCFYEFLLLDMPVWNDQHQREMEDLQKETGIFLNTSMTRIREDEYPQAE